MKVLFAVSNDKMSESIVKQYQKEYKQIISYKNVYYFNAILKELQRDKTYDRVVISEDLEQYVNTDYEQMDKFLFDKLDNITDEASNAHGEDVPIILICSERRNKSEQILVKLFGIGIYNAIIGNDRSVSEVCRLINKPRSKKEAKIYYKINSEDVSYENIDENDVDELEIQNILAHYKRLGNNEEKYAESFESIANQYNDVQLRLISKCLPLNVRAVLEETSPKYQQVNAYTTKISDKVRVGKKVKKTGTSEILLKNGSDRQLNEPVVIPSSIDTSKSKKIIKQAPIPKQEFEKENLEPIFPKELDNDEVELDDLIDINDIQEIEPLPKIEEIPEAEEFQQLEETDKEDNMQEVELPEISFEDEETENNINEVIEEQAPKRKRGRPRKIVTEPVEPMPKRKRGRPRKNPEPVEIEDEEIVLPGLEDTYIPEEINEEDDETILPGLDDNYNNEEDLDTEVLPGLADETEFEDIQENEEIQPIMPEEIEEPEEDVEEDQYANVLNNLRMESREQENYNSIPKREAKRYPELDMESLLTGDKKLVAFVGTSKNGTSFLINNVAEILSMNGIDTAILDLTQNRNAYYIYTKNEEELRNQSNYIMNNLKIGRVNGLQEHRNLTVYTSAFENDENLNDVEPIIDTLVRNHTVVLMDCDFYTPMRYFKYAQEIYLVQSMDILTIQPLTAFLRQLSDRGMIEESKIRVVLNKFIRTREINEDLLVGGISIYNDASMTVRKEIFNRKTVKRITIPFDIKSYLRYLDGLVICDVSLKGYTKEFLQSIKNLASMVYQGSGKYTPPSIKNNNNSKGVNNDIDEMNQNY